MAIGTDFEVQADGDIRHVSGTTTYTVLEFHRWLQDLADDAQASGDDLLDITDSTPSERSTDNIITLNAPFNIDDTAAEYLYDGSITQAGGDVVYSGLVVVGSVTAGTQLQIVQNNALLTSYWGTGLNADATANILLRIMVLTRTGGSDIDGKRIRVTARELGDSYAEFSATLGQGNSTAAIFTGTDLNNQTAAGTIAGWTITNTEGYQLLDVDGNSVGEPYYSQWDKGSQSINDLYEYTKWIQRRGTSTAIHGLNGDLFRGITHQWTYSAEASGPYVEDEILTWGTGSTAGTGKLLALLDSGTTGTLWIQLLTGVAPTTSLTVTGPTNSTTSTVGTVTSRTISPAFIGQSTGSAIIGAFGVGIDPTDLTASDLLFDLTNTPRTPPNNVTFTVGGLVSGEDRVLVGPESGGLLDESQFTLGTDLTGATETTVDAGAAIPTDTPATGTIRIELDSGIYRRVPYTSYSGSDFTIASTSFATDNATTGNNVYISYIDELASGTSASFTSVFLAPRSLFIRVRDGGTAGDFIGIKTFETTGTLGSAGGSTTAIRTSDA
jgi:hypothetical protein